LSFNFFAAASPESPPPIIITVLPFPFVVPSFLPQEAKIEGVIKINGKPVNVLFKNFLLCILFCIYNFEVSNKIANSDLVLLQARDLLVCLPETAAERKTNVQVKFQNPKDDCPAQN
jgi:hypothetical protein